MFCVKPLYHSIRGNTAINITNSWNIHVHLHVLLSYKSSSRVRIKKLQVLCSHAILQKWDITKSLMLQNVHSLTSESIFWCKKEDVKAQAWRELAADVQERWCVSGLITLLLSARPTSQRRFCSYKEPNRRLSVTPCKFKYWEKHPLDS